MSKVLERATNHFRAKISGEMKTVDVPEWDTKIYYKPSVSLREQGKLIELANQGKTVEALVETLIIKARNEDGSKMFSLNDKMVMLNEVDPNVIIRVVGQMSVPAEEYELETAEKN